MRVALRVDVGSLRGLREGVPNLLRLFGQYRVRASFFFPLGRDFSGRRPKFTLKQGTLRIESERGVFLMPKAFAPGRPFELTAALPPGQYYLSPSISVRPGRTN